jgi:hypothetical protein
MIVIEYVLIIALMALATVAVSVARRRRIRREAGFPLSRRRASALKLWCGL